MLAMEGEAQSLWLREEHRPLANVHSSCNSNAHKKTAFERTSHKSTPLRAASVKI